MACLDMYNQNSEHKGLGGAPPMSPRISFSNDFVESSSSHSHSHSHQQIRAPVSSDFEFSVSNYSMMSADELFFKGRLLPFKESSSQKTTTLRDELQNEEEEEVDFSLRPPKNFTRWKRGFLGLRKSHIGSKKPADKSEGYVEKRAGFHHEDTQYPKNSQDSVE
ncbi:hypothetical protein Adt_25244 [Abeliophyllum distichum]|uniref:Uncharacterized protein n=1 Tax=Abeliophyllum distichum TaxID=126358 RepID=A0ABD1SHL4_9LAMI